MVVAQKAGTVGVLSEGRFTLGLGAGENLNEHVIGRGWPPVDTRHEMFDEAIEIIAKLLGGDYVTYHGEYFDADSAKVYDLPESRIPIGVAASGPRSAEIAARRGDSLILNEPLGPVVEKFRSSGGGDKPVYGQLAVSYDEDADAALERAHRLFRWAGAGWKVMSELPGPVNFAAYTEFVRPDDLTDLVVAGADAGAVAEAVKKYEDAGFTHVALVQMGAERQEPFFRWAEEELLPALRQG